MARTRTMMLSLLIVVVIGGVGSASADATLVWLVKGKTLASSETGSATVSFGKLTIKWEDSSTKETFEAECKKASGEAELKGGEPGTDKLQSLKFKECSLLKAPTKCELTIGGVTAEELPGWSTKLETIGGKAYDSATGVSFSLILEGCEKVVLSKTWLFKGGLKAEALNESGKIKTVLPTIPVEKELLKSEGAEAILAGEGKLEEKAGGSLEISEPPAVGREFYNNSGELVLGLLNIESLGSFQVLKSELVGAPVKIECHHVHGGGWIHNGLLNSVQSGLGLFLALYSSCALVEPTGTGCTVSNSHTLAHGYVVTVSSKIYVEFTPAEGITFANLVLENCTNPSSLNGTYPLKGTAFALVDNATSELEFKAGEPNNKLKFAGNPAELEGNDQVLMEGGGKIEAR